MDQRDGQQGGDNVVQLDKHRTEQVRPKLIPRDQAIDELRQIIQVATDKLTELAKGDA